MQEAHRVAQPVLPRLKLGHGIVQPSAKVNTGSFGEIIANDHRPPVCAAQS